MTNMFQGIYDKWENLGSRNKKRKEIREELKISRTTLYRLLKKCKTGKVPNNKLVYVEKLTELLNAE